MNRKIFFFSFLFLISAFYSTASAATVPVTGYAWSDNIGWIQMNPALGGVTLDDATGDLNGYAWSDNIGWVSFDATDGSHTVSAIINNYATCGSSCTVSGWAKAIAADNNGWDGWIKMSDTVAPAYSVNLDKTTGNFSGYAWGSDVVGWISFSGTGYGVTIAPISGNQPPVAVATISKDGTTYADSITVTQGVATPIYLSASGSSDPNGWTDATYGVSSGGKCEWNSDLNQGSPTFETTINNPASPSSCNISLGTLTFNDPVGTYTYQVLRITDKPGAVSNIDTVTVAVQAPSLYTLTVSKAGSGSGTVTSAPGGITCGSDCTENYTSGTSVTLTAAADAGSTFAGWSGDCSGTGTCTLTMNAAKNVTATFNLLATLPDFDLQPSGPLHATIIAGMPAGSNQITITLVPLNGFSQAVNLSSNISSIIPGATDVFSPTQVSPPSPNSIFYIKDIPGSTAKGIHVITVTGTSADGGIIRTRNIDLNIEISNPNNWIF